jgi:hypothetical protein
MQAEAVGHRVPDRAALEEVEGAHALGKLLDRLGAQDPNRIDDVLNLPSAARGHVVGDSHDGYHQRDIGLNCLDHLSDRYPVASDQSQQPVARLGQRREPLERLERRRQPASVAFAWTHLLES